MFSLENNKLKDSKFTSDFLDSMDPISTRLPITRSSYAPHSQSKVFQDQILSFDLDWDFNRVVLLVHFNEPPLDLVANSVILI